MSDAVNIVAAELLTALESFADRIMETGGTYVARMDRMRRARITAYLAKRATRAAQSS